MKKKSIISTVVLIVCLNPLSLSAANVSLKGTVKTVAGAGIAGATVKLAKDNTLSATTDAQGAFSIIGEIGVNVDPSLLSERPRFQFSLAGNKLVIVPALKNIEGRVDVFSNNGRRSASVGFRGTNSGKQTVNLQGFAPGFNIIRITIGKETFTQRLIRVGNGVDYFGNDAHSADRPGNFLMIRQASAAAVDTLITTKSGYTEVKTPIDSYEKEGIAIVMQEEQPIGEMPLVYDKEYMGADCPKPNLVDNPTTLPPIEYLPDPFLMADGKTRMTTKAQWNCRRAELYEMIMKYEGGQKPPKPELFQASLSGNTINITMGVGGNSFSMKATISRPGSAPKDKPIPAIINKGSLSFDFAGRGIATISYTQSDVTGSDLFGSNYQTGNFYKLYPNTDAGYMVRWAWQVSRIIDALEMLPEAYIDTKRLAVSGCSYGGKIALYSGAMDERIALTIPHESGGGGTISWRYSDMLETRDNTEV